MISMIYLTRLYFKRSMVLLQVLIFPLSVLFSCSSKVEEKENHQSSTATFEIQKIEAYSAEPEFQGISEKDWLGIPNHNLVQIKTCLVDSALGVALEHEDIKITTPFAEKIIQTNKKGCLTWSENLEFDFLSKEALFSYNVIIEGLGHHTGEESLELAINPWKKSAKALLDLRYDKSSYPITKDIRELKQYTEEKASDFISIDHINIKKLPKAIIKENHLVHYEYDLELTATLKRYAADDKIIFENLKTAAFNIEAILIESESSYDQNWELSRTKIKAKLNNGKLKERLSFPIKHGQREHPNSQFQMLFKITPTKKEFAKVIKGTLMMADIATPTTTHLTLLKEDEEQFNHLQLKSNLHTGSLKVDGPLLRAQQESLTEEKAAPTNSIQLAELKEDIKKNTEQFLAQQAKISETQEIPVDDDWAYKIKRARPEYGGFLKESFGKANKTLRSRSLVCLVASNSNDQRSPLTKTKFKVSFIDENGKYDGYPEQRIHTTDSDGCFETYFYTHFNQLSCERFIDSTMIIEALDGNVKGIKKSRKFSVNPMNKNDFSYDLGLGQRPPVLDCKHPKMAVQNDRFEYFYLGNDRASFKLNQYLHLSMEKKYQLIFKPLIQLESSYQKEELPTPLNFGEVRIELGIFSPKHSDIDYLSPELDQFSLVSATSKIVTIRSTGLINDYFNFPFKVSDLPSLSNKALLFVKIIPLKRHGLLRPAQYALPFHAFAKKESTAGSELLIELNQDIKIKMATLIKNSYKLPGLHDQQERSFNQNFKSSPLELYRAEILAAAKKSNEKAQLNASGLKDFNAKYFTAFKLAKMTSLRSAELRMLTKESGETPSKILRKFCPLYYQQTDIKNINNCLKNPKSFIALSPTTHIQELVKSKELSPELHPGLAIITPTFKGKGHGKISRGNAFFAAFGDRSSFSKGEREGLSKNTNFSFGIEGIKAINPFYFGASKGVTKSYETFSAKYNDKMKAAFQRNYTSREAIKLSYDQLNLGFTAKVRHCIAIKGLKQRPTLYHICEDRERFKKITESWFFIKNENGKEDGALVNANGPEDTQPSQIIRGQANFNRIWKSLKKEDTLTVIKEIGEFKPDSAFDSFTKEKKTLIPFENQIDNSFPGLILPVKN